jgi:hypothetical protein
MVNHYDIYSVDEDFGRLFPKFCSCFPYNAKPCINCHEYLERQLAKRGAVFEALDNGIESGADLFQTLLPIRGQGNEGHIDAPSGGMATEVSSKMAEITITFDF